MALAKIILIIGGIAMAGAVGFVAYKTYYSSWSGGSVEISGTPTDGIKMDIPDITGKKIGDIAWSGGSEPLPEPFGTLIPVFKPSQIAGVTRLDEPFARSVAFMTDAAPAAVSDFYRENLPKNGWALESSKPPVVKAIYSSEKFQKKSGDLTEVVSVVVYAPASTGKVVFSITYTKTSRE